jgi:hypothetical protein
MDKLHEDREAARKASYEANAAQTDGDEAAPKKAKKATGGK